MKQDNSNTGKPVFSGDSLLEQITNITKAHAFDIVSDQNKELQEENTALKARVKYLEDLIREYTFKMKANLSGGKVDQFLKEQITQPENDIPANLYISPSLLNKLDKEESEKLFD